MLINKENIRKPHEILAAMDKHITSQDDFVLLEQLKSELQVSLAIEEDKSAKRSLDVDRGDLKVARLSLVIACISLAKPIVTDLILWVGF